MENYQDWDVDNQLSWYDEVYVEIENLVGDMVESFWEEKNKIQCCLNKGYTPESTARLICNL